MKLDVDFSRLHECVRQMGADKIDPKIQLTPLDPLDVVTCDLPHQRTDTSGHCWLKSDLRSPSPTLEPPVATPRN